MKAKPIAIHEWLESLKEATQDLLRTSLRFEQNAGNGKGKNPRNGPPKSVHAPGEPQPGAYIAVLGEANSMHLGISTTREGCAALARGLLGMRGDQRLSDKDAVDGLSEVMNIIAGKVKSQMSDRDHSLRLGMPIFMEQEIQMRDNMERVTANVNVGPVPCQLLVFRNKKAA